MSDHVDAICEAVRAAGAPVVLAVHSGAGVSGYGASDKVSVEKMVRLLVPGLREDALDDEVDAVAVGLAGLARAKLAARIA